MLRQTVGEIVVGGGPRVTSSYFDDDTLSSKAKIIYEDKGEVYRAIVDSGGRTIHREI